jgi:hypothetical protein
MIRIRAKIRDEDKGFKKLLGSLGDMGTVTVGVQGKEADEQYDDGTPVGQVAAAHELELVPGAPKRSWLRDWIDENKERMLKEAQAKFTMVMAGATTRNKALQELGYNWTVEVKKQFDDGTITPPLSAYTIKRKGGETRPLVETFRLRNAITYKIWLPNKKSVKDPAQRRVLFGPK